MDKPQFESLEEMAEATAAGLVEISSGEADRLFHQPQK